MSIKPVTVRFTEEVYNAASKAAKDEDNSFNTFVMESVQERLRRIEEENLYNSFTLLGEDMSPEDIDFGLDAQREVVESEMD